MDGEIKYLDPYECRCPIYLLLSHLLLQHLRTTWYISWHQPNCSIQLPWFNLNLVGLWIFYKTLNHYYCFFKINAHKLKLHFGSTEIEFKYVRRSHWNNEVPVGRILYNVLLKIIIFYLICWGCCPKNEVCGKTSSIKWRNIKNRWNHLSWW